MNSDQARCSLFRANSLIAKLGWRLLPGSIAAVFVVGLLQLGVWQPLEDLAYIVLFRLRGPTSWSDRVVVVEIDEASLESLGRFPWSRHHYTNLLRLLTPAEPSVIVLDILFPEPSPEDADLANAMTQQGRVILAQSWDNVGSPLLPTPILEAAALGTGHVYRLEDPDGLVRIIEPQKQGVPALGVVAAQVHSLVYEPIQLPNPHQPFWINWSASAHQFTHYSFIEVLRGTISPTVFQNKIVLIGVTAAALDTLQTPYDRNPPTSGVYLQAAFISNLIQQRGLQRPNAGWLPLALLLVGPGLSVVLTYCRLDRQLGIWVGGGLGWGILSVLLLTNGYWIPVVTPMVLLTLTTTAVILVDQHRITRLLQQSEERYGLAVQGTHEGLWDWHLKSDLIYLSPRWKAMLGYSDEQPTGAAVTVLPPLERLYRNQHNSSPQERSEQEWFSRVHPNDVQGLQEAIAAHLNGATAYFKHEYRMSHQNGSYRWMLSRGLAVRDRNGNAYRMVGSQSDITARKEAEEQLQHNAFYDELTGLPNRALFLERLREAIALNHKYPGIAFAVLWLDLDHFKVVNNSLGSALGDRLLVAVAQRLKGYLSNEDVVARIGGDEFVLLLNQIQDVTDATRTADRVQQLLALPFNLNGREVFTTSSIGIALSSLLYSEPEHLMRDADTAMHRAKASGRCQYQVFDTAMHVLLLKRLQVENDLRRAIAGTPGEGDRHELHLFYQPIVHLATKQMAGFEALVRWRHPEQGIISPARFIPMAEETGLIIQLGWWVIQQACRQMRQWSLQFPQATDLTVSVNLSSKQFSMSGLIERIRQILEETTLPGSALKLEITESTVMENAASVVAVLHQIRSLGIQLAIDDFGTGYSSLSYLPRFPINTLKIDRSFVSKMSNSHDSLEIVRTILVLAHNLGMDVTAEGVETLEQATLLLDMNCTYGQGYWFAKPLDSEAATQFLQQQLTK